MEVKLTLSDDATSKKVEITGILDNKEKKVIEGYSEEASKLRETNFVQQNMPIKLNLNWKRGEELKSSTELPSRSDMGELLMALRPLILKDEFCSFERTAGLIGKNFKHEFIWKTLKSIRELYEGEKLKNLINIESHKLKLISEKFLFKWLNAYQYHRDLSKQQDLEPLYKFFPRDSIDGICTFLLSEKVIAITQLEEIVSIILGSKQEIRTQRKN